MLQMIKEAIDNKVLKIYDRPTITEMFSFIEVQTTTMWRAQAEKNAHDDLVMALAIAYQLYQTETPPLSHKPIDFPDDTKLFTEGYY